eukprot:CAMPEP_0171367188 /NCGR_PEP_ID=MMETSP0879-20121228/5928_1 /TAXON_ID=67004 /ORGANISM="Thalassiosira weissflogii, Strain CCMP1336" /LENGTH=487 /DNA_ID=CAMNT_0011875187 /DNA_START=14 /DNA_END=1474 /DNA_ORIENTATION=-
MTIDDAAEYPERDDLITPLYEPSCKGDSARPEETGTTRSSSNNVDNDKEPILGTASLTGKSTSDTAAQRAAYAAMFAVFVDAINMMCIAPNLPIMVTPGLHEDSFPSTEPFDIATAQYAHDAVEALGMVISNFVFGYIADRIGSRKAILLLMIGSCCTSVGIYLVRSNYWSFIAMTFANGLFGSAAAIANGYMFIIYKNDREKADEFGGYVMATLMVGLTVGGLFTLFFPSNLFRPLLLSSALCFLAFVVCFIFVFVPSESPVEIDSEPEEDDIPLDKRAISNVIIGASFDHLGTLGIYPLAFSPVMYQRFFLDFQIANKVPIMSGNEYRWLFSMIGLAAVPAALLMPLVNKKLGVAISTIISNLITAGAIIALLSVAAIDPPTHSSFVLYATIIYATFPFALLSQLSSGAMLDRVTPHDQKSLAQGINNSLYDFATIFTILFGWISDTKGYNFALFVCFGLSIVGAFVNVPLIFNKRLGRKEIGNG